MEVLTGSQQLAVTIISLALLLNVVSLSWADDQKSEAKEQTVAEGGRPKLEENDWKPYWASLIAEGPESEKTPELLSKLKEVFDEHEVPSEFSDEKKIIDDLIAATQTGPQPCTGSRIKALAEDEFREYSRYNSFRTYMLGYKNWFTSKCKSLIIKKLSASCISVKPSNILDINQLMEDLILLEVPPGFPRPKISDIENFPQRLIEAINNFLFTKRSSKRIPMLEIYQNHIITPCRNWLDATSKVLGLYNHIDHMLIDNERKERLGREERSLMCQYICNNDEDIKRKLRLH